jgi:Flp pilus assembly protein TadG
MTGNSPMTLFSRFQQNRSGAVAVIFALSIVPLLGIAGAAVDYGRASSSRSKLNSAADAAALAALKARPTENPETVGRRVFNGQFSSYGDANLTLKSLSVQVNNARTTAKVQYSADVKLLIASILQTSMEISGKAEATTGAPQDRDIFLMVDNSVSMQFPIDMSGRIPVGSNGCIFACHVTHSEIRGQGVISRLDAGITAFKKLTADLALSQGNTTYYPLASSSRFVTLAPATRNRQQVLDALDRIAFDNSTHFGEHMSNLASMVAGVPSARQRIVILMTDGLEEHRNTDYAPPPPQDPAGDPTWVGAPDGVGSRKNGLGFPNGTSGPQGFVAACNAIKASNARIFAIYTPNYGNYPSFDPGHQENEPASRAALRNCSSPNMFYVADSPGSLDRAVSDIVGQVSKLRISK